VPTLILYDTFEYLGRNGIGGFRVAFERDEFQAFEDHVLREDGSVPFLLFDQFE